MPEVEEVLKDMAEFLNDTGLQKSFEDWMLKRGHDQNTIDSYNEIIAELD
jgi:hypothetical protein